MNPSSYPQNAVSRWGFMCAGRCCYWPYHQLFPHKGHAAGRTNGAVPERSGARPRDHLWRHGRNLDRLCARLRAAGGPAEAAGAASAWYALRLAHARIKEGSCNHGMQYRCQVGRLSPGCIHEVASICMSAVSNGRHNGGTMPSNSIISGSRALSICDWN